LAFFEKKILRTKLEGAR